MSAFHQLKICILKCAVPCVNNAISLYTMLFRNNAAYLWLLLHGLKVER